MEGPRVTLGRIAGVFGVRGWVKLHSYSRPAESILRYPSWWIAHGNGFTAQVLEGHPQAGGVVARITGADGAAIEDRDVAAALIGSSIEVARSALPKLKKGQFYWVDLIGLEVQSAAGAKLGRIDDMTSNGAQDVMVVRDGETERLIPFVHGAVVQKVDLASRRVVCDWEPEW
jgi:16S rRNA processing protein RimM